MHHTLLRFALFTLIAGLAFAGTPQVIGVVPNLSEDLRGLGLATTADVIVQFKEAPQQSHFNRVLSRGGRQKRALPLVNGALFSMPAGGLAALAADPDVAYISSDRPVRATLDYSQPTVYADMALNLGFNGRRVGVAVIDSGVFRSHRDLKRPRYRVVYEESFLPNVPGTEDEYGHGSHVAGIVAGNGTKSGGNTWAWPRRHGSSACGCSTPTA